MNAHFRQCAHLSTWNRTCALVCSCASATSSAEYHAVVGGIDILGDADVFDEPLATTHATSAREIEMRRSLDARMITLSAASRAGQRPLPSPHRPRSQASRLFAIWLVKMRVWCLQTEDERNVAGQRRRARGRGTVAVSDGRHTSHEELDEKGHLFLISLISESDSLLSVA